MKIYYKWSGGCKYEFYIDIGKHGKTTSDDPVSLMININIIGGGKVSNKRGRLKKQLISDFVIETKVLLSKKEKKHYIELEPNEFKKILETYDISEVQILQ